ncbi:MAG: hypothetical protein GEU94_06330 [Micromonosporaceae bacterium]|nr:hypothetical protein [Micromonosporaceae bacterium]
MALRLAIDVRGLGLERLRDRLAARGHRVSVSTLSNWQRGVSRPGQARSRRALAALEEVLEVPAEGLSRLLGPRRHSRHEVVPGTPRARADVLRAQLDAAERSTTVVSTYERTRIGPEPADWQNDERLVVGARRSGVDRHVTLYHSSEQTPLPELTAGPTCRLGRVRTGRAAGLLVAELLFDRTLSRGETYPVEYRLSGKGDGLRGYTGRWFRDPDAHFDLDVRWETPTPPRAAYRIWRLDAHSPHKDREEIRLIGGRVAHVTESGLEPGFHGIRWEW